MGRCIAVEVERGDFLLGLVSSQGEVSLGGSLFVVNAYPICGRVGP